MTLPSKLSLNENLRKEIYEMAMLRSAYLCGRISESEYSLRKDKIMGISEETLKLRNQALVDRMSLLFEEKTELEILLEEQQQDQKEISKVKKPRESKFINVVSKR